MLKTILFILGATSLSWASNNFYDYNSNYGVAQGYYSGGGAVPPLYSPIDPQKIAAERQKAEAQLLQEKLQILSELIEASRRNQQICQDRKECLKLDFQLLAQLLARFNNSRAGQELLMPLKSQLEQIMEEDITVTEWDVYNSLSENGKKDYLAGVRINSPAETAQRFRTKENASPKGTPSVSGRSIKFNLDDLKLYLLQEIEKNHQQCNGRSSCLQSDLQLVKQVKQFCPPIDAAAAVFDQMIDGMQDRARKQRFMTIQFYQMYQDYLSKQYPLLYKSQERQQWNDMVKSLRPTSRRDAIIINQQEIKEDSAPEKEAEKQLKTEGKKVATELLGQFFGENDQAMTKGKDLLDSLFNN